MLDGDVTDSVEARSLVFNRDHIHIYSASWGTRRQRPSSRWPGNNYEDENDEEDEKDGEENGDRLNNYFMYDEDENKRTGSYKNGQVGLDNLGN